MSFTEGGLIMLGNLMKQTVMGLLFIFLVSSLFVNGAWAEEKNWIVNTSGAEYALYTLPELQNAKPMPLPEVVMPENALQTVQYESLPPDAIPYVSPGWSPGDGPQPDPSVSYAITEDSPLYNLATGGVDFQTYGAAPTDPLNGPYGPFQRWTWYGNYTKQATQRIGKLFFDTTGDGIRNATCTATVIGQRTIATAAHCLRSGGSSGSFYSRWLFCPSYYRGSGSGSPHPSRGCWGWTYAEVSSAWVSTSGGATDRDYACIVTAPTGDTVSNKVGNVTGWLGRAMNWGSSQLMFSWGYPAASPFPGYHIIVAVGPEWYEVNMTSGDGQVSKYMGNDMTGGSSGGPWLMSIRHNTYEYNDTDGSSATDPPGCSSCAPGGPYLNGVNSHKRCKGSCFTPPTASAWTYWQEMGSPQFRNTSGDTDESEDIFADCFAME